MPIKSFQAARQKLVPKRRKSLLVRDYMTRNLITFTKKQSILEVMRTLIRNKISGGPVVDELSRLIGVISEADCIKYLSEGKYFNQPFFDRNVEDSMTAEVDVIEADKTIFDAATLFHKTNRRRFPVLDRGKLVGQISRQDVVKAALLLRSQRWR
ncbi:MAG: Inosine-5'-monophosphate dehydrogenase [Flavobacteriales bacterium]|jgi:predicted transcriptional regulator|nr:MAG: CBS domain-containing protein [Flavobacteriales bacterium]CAI8272971.1 MAG: Inosine-5'-monophosphate dehydrogenase [Flavobacteriales bacterium]|tara:strand:- start:423 stop:887 length:465 start_codon:yes stop_codon:yes gene_type:complete